MTGAWGLGARAGSESLRLDFSIRQRPKVTRSVVFGSAFVDSPRKGAVAPSLKKRNKKGGSIGTVVTDPYTGGFEFESWLSLD